MKINRNGIKKILVITLTNLGDIILTTPVVEVLLREFPDADLDVMAGPQGFEVFEKHPKISEIIIYDKFKPLSERLKLIFKLQKKKYSMIVDLRNTLMPYLIGAPYRSLPFERISKYIVHKRDVHLWKLRVMGININNPPSNLYIDPSDKEYANNLLKGLGAGKIAVISASAKSNLKRWTKEGFSYVVNGLIETGFNIVMIGSKEEKDTIASIIDAVNNKDKILNLSGETTIRQLIAVVGRADLLITNDSAPLHIASMLNRKVLALFGPTDSKEYGPLSEGSIIFQKPVYCAPCKEAHCWNDIECMKFLSKEKVFEIAKEMLRGGSLKGRITEPKRILLIRTDRIGDVVLSTPAIKAVYDTYLNSYIAFMVQPYTKDVVDGNPYLDEVIVFDKKKTHKGIWGAIKIIKALKKNKFNIAFVLHPTNRVHIAAFLAGIPERIGYDKKMGFLLTKRIPHTKQLGQKHELEYTLDVLRAAGIEPKDKKLFMPLGEKASKKVGEFLLQNGIKRNDILVCIHPGASCPSKKWDVKKFAALADKIIESFGVKIAVIAGFSDIALGNELAAIARNKVLNFSGVFTVGELAPFLKRCTLFVSNDSGPVHIAVAVDTPVISIFGRNEKGLSPTRWKPLGKDDVVIHKDVGCEKCLAHDCKKGFECLKSLEADEVLNAVYKFKDRLKR
ncbi:MAG: hypothetical protein COS99_03660 [Candidatus Omnitrophica bacterium CG07_land_8_20_14_0_80_42_15]|uniref:Lipopolysaccharide heptosyltransferase II n=1 Tax=Candidatus Aquitaenariimonas noxiae TaxID=1974741 RepID=A0A2J0KTF4_9BACT|nr:MAG: hypothetical protein COS99_03660 [Candidatus Omnitrophica bacterium CG07_land_8_20_14_0_80_42_15]